MTVGQTYAPEWREYQDGQPIVIDGEARHGCISRVDPVDGKQIFESNRTFTSNVPLTDWSGEL